MRFDNRLGWWLIGCFIGFVMGYSVRALREIREIKSKVEKVDEHVLEAQKKQNKKESNDAGFLNNSLSTNLALFLVILMTAYAAFVSQRTSNKVQDNQNDDQKAAQCTQTYLVKTIAALNARTRFSQEQAVANMDLQRAQASFLGVFFTTPKPTAAQRTTAFKDYYISLTHYNEVSGKTNGAVERNPYPTPTELTDCLTKGK